MKNSKRDEKLDALLGKEVIIIFDDIWEKEEFSDGRAIAPQVKSDHLAIIWRLMSTKEYFSGNHMLLVQGR